MIDKGFSRKKFDSFSSALDTLRKVVRVLESTERALRATADKAGGGARSDAKLISMQHAVSELGMCLSLMQMAGTGSLDDILLDDSRTVSERLEAAKEVLRRHYPEVSDTKLREKAAELAIRRNLEQPTTEMAEALLSDVETGLHPTTGFQFRYEPRGTDEDDKKDLPFTFGNARAGAAGSSREKVEKADPGINLLRRWSSGRAR